MLYCVLIQVPEHLPAHLIEKIIEAIGEHDPDLALLITFFICGPLALLYGWKLWENFIDAERGKRFWPTLFLLAYIAVIVLFIYCCII